MVMVVGLLLAPLQCRPWNIRVYLGDAPHGLGPSLPEHHAGVRADVLGVLDEPEAAAGLVPSPQVLLVHEDYGGCLSGAPTVH